MGISSVSIGKPAFFLLIPVIFLLTLFVFSRFKKITTSLGSSSEIANSSSFLRSLTFSFFSRIILTSLSLIFTILALCEISWGTKKIPVHKSGSNITFVFDISYSMLAPDCPQKLTRLDAAKIYASSLLGNLPSSSFSAVLAKGDGFVAIPETEDTALLENMIQNLSPLLMTSSGSSLGKGIEAAIHAIPAQSAKEQHILVFTDGDETDNGLESALETALSHGLSVTLIGFGSETETEITAGDGMTRVKTALRAKTIKELIQKAENRSSYHAIRGEKKLLHYVDSKEQGSAWKILSNIQQNPRSDNDTTFSYEVQNVNHHTVFIFLAVLCLVLSVVCAEFSPSGLKKLKALLFSTALFAVFSSFSSCSSEKKQILEGTWAWYESKYTNATADFLTVAENAPADSLASQYAIFDLSATYLSMNELDSARERLSQIQFENTHMPPELTSASVYNMGIIYERQGDFKTAKQYFKQAILANPKNLNAKINLELCERELVQKRAKSGKTELQGIHEEKADNSDSKSELFTVIHEQEGKKWRNMQQSGENQSSEADY